MPHGTKRTRRPGHSPRQLQARAGNVGHASYQALCAQIMQSATTGKAAVQPSTLRRKRREGLFVKRQLACLTVEEHKSTYATFHAQRFRNISLRYLTGFPSATIELEFIRDAKKFLLGRITTATAMRRIYFGV